MPARGIARIAVFGSSEPADGERDYERARRVGRLIARRGGTVVSGGYGGVMEAASRGARDEGGPAIGVTCAEFSARRPNRFLTEVIEENDLFDRTRRLIVLSSGFIILPGKSGTLAEVAFLWALKRAGRLGSEPIVLLGAPWKAAFESMQSAGLLEPSSLAGTRLADEEADAVNAAFSGGPAGRSEP